MKWILLTTSLLLLQCGNAVADYYSAKTTLNYPGNKIHSGGFAKVNDETFITYMDGKDGKGVYAVSRRSGDSRLIMANNTNFNAYALWDVYFRPLNDGALIDLYGKLYFTDGTKTGTRFIANFGYGNTGGSLGYDFSRVQRIIQAGRFLYLYQTPAYALGGGPDQDAAALWRIDLRSLTRTKIAEYGDSDGQLLESRFLDSDRHGKVIIFASRVNRKVGLMLLSPGSNQPEPLALFDDLADLDTNFGTIWSVRTRAGLFFCRYKHSGGKRSVSVWRLSNSNTLARIAGNCGSLGRATANSSSDQLYFLLNEAKELWRNSGTATSNRLIRKLTHNDDYFGALCAVTDHIIAGTVRDVPGRPRKYGVYVYSNDGSERYLPDVAAMCAGDRVILFSPNTSDITHVYAPQNNQLVRVYGMSPGQLQGYQQFSDEVLWLYRRKVSETLPRDRRYRDRIVSLLFKEGQYSAFMPGILQLLDEGESE